MDREWDPEQEISPYKPGTLPCPLMCLFSALAVVLQFGLACASDFGVWPHFCRFGAQEPNSDNSSRVAMLED